MAIKIAISLTALSLIQIGMAEVWDRKGSAPIVGQDRQAHYLFIPHHCRITARWVGRGVVARLVWWRWFSTQYEAETFVFSRIYCNIRKPLMPIRYPIAFRGTARPSVCSAWRLKVPKLGAFPKLFACFSLICSSRNSVLFRNFLLVSALFVQAETRCFSETFCLFQPYLLKAKPYIVPKTRCSSETFCLFQSYLFKSKPYIVPKLGVFPKPFACLCLICSSRNPRFRGTWSGCASA